MYIDYQNRKKPKSIFRRVIFFRLPVFLGTVILIAVFSFPGYFIWKSFSDIMFLLKTKPETESSLSLFIQKEIEKEKEEQKEESLKEPAFRYQPVKISMKEMKTKGCVADGFLSEYGDDTEEAVDMINHSECLYLHRALETWNAPPDFYKASKIMEQIKPRDLIYGMFIAEAIDTRAIYYYPEEERFFDFRTMCRDGSENAWGEHTCKPSFSSGEYRKYLKYITRRAMDLGIQSFLFGQVYYQDSPDLSKSKIPDILDEMRKYAKKKNMEIVIGAQTGNITNEKYLKRFSYIEGGVGIGDDGRIEEGPCWSHIDSCWALLWHKNYASKADNVFLHLDWSGLSFDDMSVFSRMDTAKRAEVLKELYKYFTSRDMGFLMPLMATLPKNNGGCFGPNEGFYSASRAYSCKDENVINLILKGK